MNFTRAAINRPVFVLMLMAAAILIGALSFNSMRIELNPEVNFGVVTVSTVYPGAGPEEMNNLVTRKVEDAISGVNGIRELTSTSTEGVSVVVATLELDVNQDAALNDVRSKVDSVTNSLPKEALKPTVTKFDNSGSAVVYYSLSSNLNSRELRDLSDRKLKDRFGSIKGVAAATVTGGDVREFQVQVSKDKLMQYGIGISDLLRTIQAATLNTPSGKLVTANQEYSVRIKGEFKSVADLEALVFHFSNPANPADRGRTVRLSDIAKVLDTVKERSNFARLDGKETVVLGITKTREGNAVEITAAADNIVKDIVKQPEYKAVGLKFEKTTDTAKQITESLDDVRFAIIFGIFLVCVIVYIFLHDWRGTLIVGTAIPTCVFATFIALKGMGFTINNLSMLSLSLAVGVLVDDAIVVLENIYRHLKKGEDPKQAALNGRAEIGSAALAITFADVVVFTPIGFMGGIVGQFFKPLALGFVAAVLFSLLVSFSLTPMLASRWYAAGEDIEHPKGRFAPWFERNFHKFEMFYKRILTWALAHRWLVFTLGNLGLVGVFAFIAGGFTGLGLLAAPNPTAGLIKAAMGFAVPMIGVGAVIGIFIMIGHAAKYKRLRPIFILNAVLFAMILPFSFGIGGVFGMWKKEAPFKFSFLPSSDSGTVKINIETAAGTSLDATGLVAAEVESRIKGDEDVKYILTTVGQSGGGGFGGGGNSGSNYAQILITLNDKEAPMDRLSSKHSEKLRRRSAEAVAGSMLLKVGKVPGAFITVSAQDAFGFGSAIQMSFTSDNRELLTATALKIKQALQAGAIKGVINPDLSSKPGKPEIQAIPDRQKMADSGLSVAELGQAARTLYQGNDDTKLRINGDEYGIRVMVDRKDRDDPNLVQEMPVKFVAGLPIFLGSVAKLEEHPALDKIERRNRVEEVKVFADLLPGYAAGSVQSQIDAWLKEKNMIPEGVLYKTLGQADAQAREGVYMITAFGLGLILVYMLLASLYDNLIYPLIIQLAQPQALVGAILALVITDKAFSLIGFIGLVCLTGLVGKNAILVVDYTNTLRAEGMDRHEALLHAGPTRLRPIMMTTLALILGTLPVALAIGRGSEFRETIGITIIGGISLSTVLTLVVIPCSYTIFDDLSVAMGGFFRGARRLVGMSKLDAPYEEATEHDDAEVETKQA